MCKSIIYLHLSALGDSSIDLLDYVSGVISQLLSVPQEFEPGRKETAEQELSRQRSTLTFEIGIRCLAILRYLAENLIRYQF